MIRLAGKKQGLWCVVIAAALLLLCSKSSPLFALNDWMDANIFYTMGKGLFNGQVLYRDVFDHKGPVLYLLYGVGWLADSTGFGGVFLLEILSLAIFLCLGLRSSVLLTERPLHPAWTILPGVAVTAGRAFAHGGSAEEFLLPFLAAALYGLLCVVRRNCPMPLRLVLLHGFLVGCALWLKYTVLGFYLVWVALLAALYFRRGWCRELAKSCGLYLAGMALATLPWVLYFGVNGALTDWFTAYFYDNLFLYSGSGEGGTSLVHHLWWAVRDSLGGMLLVGIFLLWALFRRRGAEVLSVCLLAAGLAATSLSGGYLVYYGLVLGAFVPLVLAPLSAALQRIPQAKPGSLLPGAALLAGVLAAWWCSPNAAQRFRTAESLPQYRFAARIAGTDSASLLNYGTLDGGFYTTTGLLPPCRYFCVTNMPLQEQWTQQDGLLDGGAVEYVVALAGNLQDRFPRYQCIDQCSYNGGEGDVTWYLYQRQG